MKDIKATAYTLKCVATNREFEDTGWLLEDITKSFVKPQKMILLFGLPVMNKSKKNIIMIN